MPTADAGGTTLEELLLAVLRSGTPLADGLRAKLTMLMHWLTDASEGESADTLPATQLLNALIQLRVLGNSPCPDHKFPTDKTDKEVDPGNWIESDADRTAGLASEANEVREPEIPATDSDADRDAMASSDGRDDMNKADEDNALLDPAAAAAKRLRKLWEDMHRDPVAGRYCSVYGDPPDIDAAAAIYWIWTRLLLICLRLPSEQADLVRGLAKDATEGYLDGQQLPSLIPDQKTGEADSELGELRELAPRLSKWPGLADDVIWLAWLAWHDEGAKCAHRPTNTRGIVDFDEELRQRFTANMRNQLNALFADAHSEPEQEPDQLVLADEALRGIVPIPLPQPGSWWADRLAESEQRLRQAKYEGRIKVLAIDLSNRAEWDNNFDRADVVTIKPDEAAGNSAPAFNRVWILRYPVVDRTGQLQKGRYVAVK